MEMIALVVLAYLQCLTGTMGSRAANRDGRVYHGLVKVVQHSMFAGAVTSLFAAFETFGLPAIAAYAVVCTAGNLTGAEVSMWIERRLGLTA